MKNKTPTTIGDMPILNWSPIDQRHVPTGKCRHFDLSTGLEDSTPQFIAIVSKTSDSFYLMRFDQDWQFITDTWHESLNEALEQAEFEYKGVTYTWQRTTPDSQ